MVKGSVRFAHYGSFTVIKLSVDRVTVALVGDDPLLSAGRGLTLHSYSPPDPTAATTCCVVQCIFLINQTDKVCTLYNLPRKTSALFTKDI